MLRPMALSAHSWMTRLWPVACPDLLGDRDRARKPQEAADDGNLKETHNRQHGPCKGAGRGYLSLAQTLSGQHVLPHQRQSQRGGPTRDHPAS